MLNCTSETRRWAGHVTALQTPTDGNANKNFKILHAAQRARCLTHPNISQRGKMRLSKCKKTSKCNRQMHAPENDMNNETHAEQKNQLTNEQIKILLSLLGHCSQARASPDAGLHHVIALQMSASGKAMTSGRSKSLASLKPFVIPMNYVQITCYTKSHARDPDDVGSADTLVYARSVV